MTRSDYYDEIAYLMTEIHTCRVKRMELMKEYAVIQHNDPYRDDSFCSQLIQYKSDLKRINDNIKKVEQRNETLKCQLEKFKRNTKDNSSHNTYTTIHNGLLNVQASPLSLKVTPSILDTNGRQTTIEKSMLKIFNSQSNEISRSIGRKSIFVDRHHDKVQNNKKKSTDNSSSQLQQVIKRTKEILDAQEINLKSISYTSNYDDDDCDRRLCRHQAIELKHTNNEVTTSEIPNLLQNVSISPILTRNLNYSNASPESCYQESLLLSSNISVNNTNGDSENIDEKSNRNASQKSLIVDEIQGEEEEEDDEGKVEQKKGEEKESEDITTSVSDENRGILRGQSYEEFLAKATFSIEDSSCNFVNESNDHESEFDSALLQHDSFTNGDGGKSNKLFDLNNMSLQSSWTIYKTEDLGDDENDDSFYD
ncbi:unnamed protein product [Heterobilharzia americana]|nr:unnamed protein product [Heterobilharzia americana]